MFNKNKRNKKIQLSIYRCTYVLINKDIMVTTCSHVLAQNEDNAKQLLLYRYGKNITGINIEPVKLDVEKILI